MPEWAWAGSFFTYFVSGCILAGGLVLQLWLKVKAQEVSDPEVAARLIAGGGELPDANTVELFRSYWSLLLSSLSSGVIVGLNMIVQKVVQWLAAYEGCPTRTEYQRAIFTKLTLAYIVNNVMIPFLVALLPVGVNQGGTSAAAPSTRRSSRSSSTSSAPRGSSLPVHGALQPVHPRAVRRLAAAEE